MEYKEKRKLNKVSPESVSKKFKETKIPDPEEIQYIFYECEECLCPFKTCVEFYEHMINLHGYHKLKPDLLLELDRIKGLKDQNKNHKLIEDEYSDNNSLLEKTDKSFDMDNYMGNLAEELLQKNLDVPLLNISLFQNAFPEIDKRINEENEIILRHIFVPDNEERYDAVEPDRTDKEPKLYELIKTCGSIPHTIADLKRSSSKFIENILKKQEMLNKANKKSKLEHEKQLIEMEKKKNDLTWTKLTEIENSVEMLAETQLEQEMFDLENGISYTEEIPDDIHINSEEGMDVIVDKCSLRTDLEIQFNDGCNERLTIVGDVNSQSTEATKAIYECNVCQDWSSFIYSDFHSHLRNHLSDLKVTSPKQQCQSCIICGYVIPSSSLKEHMMKHIDHSRCSVCQEFVAIVDIESHKTVHSKHFICGICGEVYKTKAAINRHVLYHKKGSEYSCEDCSLRFAGLEKLVRHISHKHKNIDPTYAECPYCLNLTSAIKNHVYSADVCKLKCKLCLKVEKTNEAFKEHMKGHNDQNTNRTIKLVNGDKSYDCTACHMKVSDEEKLKCHKVCHQINKMYSKHLKVEKRTSCDICGTTMLKSHYDLHMMKHSINDRCHICFKFVLKDSFSDHMDSHDLDHGCDICGQQFPSENKMIAHRFAHGRKTGLPCPDCELNFCGELARAKHVSLIHRSIDPDFVECYFCKELIGDKIEYHLFDYNVCLRRCKLCNLAFKSKDTFMQHVLCIHKLKDKTTKIY